MPSSLFDLMAYYIVSAIPLDSSAVPGAKQLPMDYYVNLPRGAHGTGVHLRENVVAREERCSSIILI